MRTAPPTDASDQLTAMQQRRWPSSARRFVRALCVFAIIFAVGNICLLRDLPDCECQVSRGSHGPQSNPARMRINDYFDRVFYINANASSRERDIMRALLRDAGIVGERITAVDPNNASVIARHNEFMATPPAYHEAKTGRRSLADRGDYANLLTFSSIIEIAIQRRYNRILILGENIRFHRSINDAFDGAVRTIPDDWKVLHLGAFQTSWDAQFIRWGSSSGEDESGSYYRTVGSTRGSFAVGIDSSVFHLVLFEAQKAAFPVDTGVLRAVGMVFPNSVIVMYPNLVIPTLLPRWIAGGKGANGGDLNDAVARRFRWDIALYAERPPPLPLPKVCVVVTMFNAADTIEYSVRSLLHQTYTNIEIIVVDDASEDEGPAIVTRMAEEDSRLLIVYNAQNKGAYASRNVGLQQCTGEIYINHDADDVSSPLRVWAQVLPLIDNRAEMTMATFIRTHLPIKRMHLPPAELFALANASRSHRHANGQFKYCCAEKLAFATLALKMEVFDRVGRFDETPFSGDAEFLERYFAMTFRTFLTEGTVNIHQYVRDIVALPPFYERIWETLYVAPDSVAGLSRVFAIGGDQRLEYRRKYQNRLLAWANPHAERLEDAFVRDAQQSEGDGG